jgi:hypothetical protein
MDGDAEWAESGSQNLLEISDRQYTRIQALGPSVVSADRDCRRGTLGPTQPYLVDRVGKDDTDLEQDMPKANRDWRSQSYWDQENGVEGEVVVAKDRDKTRLALGLRQLDTYTGAADLEAIDHRDSSTEKVPWGDWRNSALGNLDRKTASSGILVKGKERKDY